MFVHVGKAYYALEAKTMATDDFLPGPPSWDCDCGGGPPEPPPFFHLPPPPKPPGINGPLEHSLSDDCNGPWTCPALALEAGTSFGSYEDGSPPPATPEVSVPAIIISATVLGIFSFVAAVIFVSRMWRSHKAASKKASCDLDATDLYEDLPAAPPLLPGPLHQGHNCPPPLRYKEEILPLPRGALPPPPPALHLYSPEPRPDTPSDHLYHHISSGSETCSCSTSEAPCNALLAPTLQLIHSEEDEASSSSRSSHSYNSSSTATPTSSPTPAHPQTNACHPSGLFLRAVNTNGPPIVSMLPGFSSGQCTGTRHKHVNGSGHHVPSLLPSSVYSINPGLDNQRHKPASNKHSDNMVPLAQIYSPGSHLYEAATLLRPNGDSKTPNCSMVHWGNVPAPYVDVPYHGKTVKQSSNKHDSRNIPFVHNTMAHPLEYGAQNVAAHHGCPMFQHSPQNGPDGRQYHPLMVHSHQPHIHQLPPEYFQHPNHLPLPLHSSTLMPNSKLTKSMYDVARSPEDLTPTNSMPVDSIYNVNPHSDLDLIATTCLSTVFSVPNQNEYQTALDAYNLNVLPGQRHRIPDDSLGMGVSDSSGSSHPSSSNDGVVVTESSSLDSSGTSSSTLPLSTPLSNQRRDLPPLPSRADRYRIYAQNNDQSFANRSNTCRRSGNNNFTDSSVTDGSRNFKSCDDLQNVPTVDNSRLQVRPNGFGRIDDQNVANNNLAYDGVLQNDPSEQPEPELVRSSRQGFLKSSSRKSPKKGRKAHVKDVAEEHEDDVLYDQCSDT